MIVRCPECGREFDLVEVAKKISAAPEEIDWIPFHHEANSSLPCAGAHEAIGKEDQVEETA